jgi:high-affinity Fe2+/Pb2+ permease
MLKSLLGYNGNPSLSEVLAYIGYLVAVLLGLRQAGKNRLRRIKGRAEQVPPARG